MAISQGEVQSLIQRLNSRERRIRRLVLITSVMSFTIGTLAIAFLGWKLNSAQYNLAANNQEIQSLQNELASSQLQNQMNQNESLLEKQRYQAEIAHLQKVVSEEELSNKVKIDKLKDTLVASINKNIELTQTVAMKSQELVEKRLENGKLAEALTASYKEKDRLTQTLGDMRATVMEVKEHVREVRTTLENSMKSSHIFNTYPLHEYYREATQSSENLGHELASSREKVESLSAQLSRLRTNASRYPLSTIGFTSETKMSLISLNSDVLNSLEKSERLAKRIQQQVNNAGADLDKFYDFFIDTQRADKNVQTQLITANAKLDKILQSSM